ncbi:MAG TPA: helix-turn-helix transcriptional regulator [Rhizomicrobium sp.]|jgi:transcriptional regulator with XRE-family HTH domain|nr:helix-turn-helix transcriptional regulator [Rhizomicrobium sp.]
MKTAEERELSEAQSQAVAARILEELARRRISRKRLAADARISLSTLEKALNGNRGFTLATLVRLEEALAVSLRPAAKPPKDTGHDVQAPAELGAYSRAAVHVLEGCYLTLRPSFEVAGAIYAYRTDISWDGGKLVFAEAERLDMANAQKGLVSVPIPSGHIYLFTNAEGQMRMAVLGRQLRTGAMYGLLTTLHAGSGPHLQPVATPLALLPLSEGMTFGRILDGERLHGEYRQHLARALDGGFVRFPQP